MSELYDIRLRRKSSIPTMFLQLLSGQQGVNLRLPADQLVNWHTESCQPAVAVTTQSTI